MLLQTVVPDNVFFSKLMFNFKYHEVEGFAGKKYLLLVWDLILHIKNLWKLLIWPHPSF